MPNPKHIQTAIAPNIFLKISEAFANKDPNDKIEIATLHQASVPLNLLERFIVPVT